MCSDGGESSGGGHENYEEEEEEDADSLSGGEPEDTIKVLFDYPLV